MYMYIDFNASVYNKYPFFRLTDWLTVRSFILVSFQFIHFKIERLNKQIENVLRICWDTHTHTLESLSFFRFLYHHVIQTYRIAILLNSIAGPKAFANVDFFLYSLLLFFFVSFWCYYLPFQPPPLPPPLPMLLLFSFLVVL